MALWPRYSTPTKHRFQQFWQPELSNFVPSAHIGCPDILLRSTMRAFYPFYHILSSACADKLGPTTASVLPLMFQMSLSVPYALILVTRAALRQQHTSKASIFFLLLPRCPRLVISTLQPSLHWLQLKRRAYLYLHYLSQACRSSSSCHRSSFASSEIG